LGNQVLGVYNDKRNPTEVPEQFEYMLSYSKALPKYLPDFYNYLLTYPDGKPASVKDTFYWAKVKFGLKPNLRVVHVLTMYGNSGIEPTYTIAEKQLYSGHYFETALDLTFCIPEMTDPKHPGFYLIMAMGSEQAGLTGFKGSIVRKVAVDRSGPSLQKSLTAIKNALENNQWHEPSNASHLIKNHRSRSLADYATCFCGTLGKWNETLELRHAGWAHFARCALFFVSL
jgi:hypothetical protein